MVSKCDLTESSGRGMPSVYGLRFKDMSTAARKRLAKDLMRMDKDAPVGVSAAPEGDDIMLWNAIICGPSDTPWDGGIFKLTLKFTEEYPHKPPEVRFVSTMFHPNIYEDGRIDLDILQWPWWKPVYDVVAVLISLQSMLCDPDVKDPANDIAAKMFSTDEWEYNRRVLETVRKELDGYLDLFE